MGHSEHENVLASPHLNVPFHLLPRCDEVIVSAVNLVVAFESRCVRHAGSELIRILGYQVVVDSILHGT